MDIAKFIFETIDAVFDRKQNPAPNFENSDCVIATKDVVYNSSDYKTCLLDLYYIPGKRNRYPVIFLIHGGGFVAGGKEYRRSLATWFATQGFLVLNVNYGLCPDCSFPTPIKHLVSAFNWMADNADFLHADLNHIIVTGDSAGGYYASMLSALSSSPAFRRAYKVKMHAKICAAVLNCGLYDLDLVMGSKMLLDLNQKVFESYTGIKMEEFSNFDFKDICSPLKYITPQFPPTYLVYAEKDIFCAGQAPLLIDELRKNNVYFESYHTTSLIRNHCFSLEWTSKEAKEANENIRAFVAKAAHDKLPVSASANHSNKNLHLTADDKDLSSAE